MEASAISSERIATMSDSPDVLANIYEPDTNMVVWQRELSELKGLETSVSTLLEKADSLRIQVDVTPDDVTKTLNNRLAHFECAAPLIKDLANIVDMFCCLFEQESVGLRLSILDRAMCPRFHTDKVPCRLVTTYQGAGSEWLQDQEVDRSKLGAGNNGLPDHASGIYQKRSDIRHLSAGDIALLKGEMWIGNEGFGLVHRSPQIGADQKRLLLTLDFTI